MGTSRNIAFLCFICTRTYEIKGNSEDFELEEISSYEKSPDHVPLVVPIPEGNMIGISIEAEEDTFDEKPCCYLPFKLDEDYKNHYDQHSKSVFPYTCSLCGKCYSFKQSLKKHVVKNHPEMSVNYKRTSLCCSLCDMQLEDSVKLEEHVSKHHSVKIIKRGGNSEDDEFAEYFEDENAEWSADRKIIEYVPSTRNVRHNAKMSNKDAQCCGICNLQFKLQKDYKNHYDQHHAGVNPYRCRECGKPYRLRRSFTKHLEKNHPEVWVNHKRKSARCLICSVEFRSLTKLGEHVSKLHPGEKAIICVECGLKFKKLRSLRRHHAKDHAYSNLYCRYCDRFLANSEDSCIHKTNCEKKYMQIRKGDNTKGNVESVQKMNTTPELPTYCKICDQHFKFHKQYKRHHDQNHPGIKFVTCTHCGKEFSSRSNLKRHGRSFHQGDENVNAVMPTIIRKLVYKCEYCPEEIVGVSKYEEHGRDYHPGRDLFHCSHCRMGFKTKKKMNYHLKNYERGADGTLGQLCGKRRSKTQELKARKPKRRRDSQKGKISTGNDSEGRFCNICRRVLRLKKKSFNKHASICAQYEKCAMCEQRFHKSNRVQMKHHANIRHSGMIFSSPDAPGACEFKEENADDIESSYEPYFGVKEEFSNES